MLMLSQAVMRRVYANASMHARNSVSGIPAVKTFAIFVEYFLTFLNVSIKNVLYKSCGGFSADYNKKNNSRL